jgi:hypothetical protein
MTQDHALATLFREMQEGVRPHASYDVAEWNLLAAAELPGADKLDAPRLLARLDDWAEQVRRETERHYYRFLDNPSEYNNSQGCFCVLVLVTVLERDLGVGYNPERVKDASFQDPYSVQPDFRDSRDLFVHGILDGPGGTCSSMPVLYTAVGRRLGYPLKLVEAPGHRFSRWDDPLGTFNGVPDVFNIDACGHGFASYPDAHYRTWPRPWTDAETQCGRYLVSLSPAGELACFLATRGSCLEDNQRIAVAFQCFDWAYQLTKDQRYYSEAARLQRSLAEEARQALAHIEDLEKMRRQRDQKLAKHLGSAVPRVSSSPGFVPLEMRDVGHGAYCQCANCYPKRFEILSKRNGDFGHGLNCPCLACRENQQLVTAGNRDPFMPRPFGHFP